MSPFVQQLTSLAEFTHIKELIRLKNPIVKLQEWPIRAQAGIKILCVLEGKFEWIIENKLHFLYPNDVVVLCPGQSLGSPSATLEIGSLAWITLQPESFELHKELALGKWSAINDNDQKLLGRLLVSHSPVVLNNLKQPYELLQRIENEIKQTEFAYQVRVNQLIDELIVTIVRQLSQQQNQRRDFPQAFAQLEQMLRDSLDHPWTVEEMATVVGLGSTAFTEKVKAFSGFSPLNYLINIRIAEAMKQLRQSQKSLTDIALDTGFYSSQHFSTTFKKLTGYTPGQFRKRGQE
ncbi:AraC family transcriptional regulator [Runella sp. MFBS21]|uniref:AraC family transcriptional regulator n=1 Tax=Runella sp. MFBS21 TaxID=3034018 RepID=UPI0023F74620|nr:AraC family transcriptional regulator [Runella sp. MFBS21]MDF7819239.1 AraC family transcriptional regulator [Runella sp. MFBS21]